MTQLDEANAIIKGLYEHGSEARDFKGYYDKYLKPKDPLFEKWKGFAEDWGGECQTGWVTFSYDAFKELFADELNGTNGLDYAIEHYKLNNVGLNSANSIVYVLTEIKAKYK